VREQSAALYRSVNMLQKLCKHITKENDDVFGKKKQKCISPLAVNKACTACSTVSCPRHDELAVVLVTEQQDRSYTTTSCSRICTVGRQHVLFHRSTPSSRNNSLHCDRSIDPSHR
jgi:hypothetical protein